MARWVETTWYRWKFSQTHSEKTSNSNKFNDGRWRNDYWSISNESLAEALNALTSFCNEGQYEVKSIMTYDRAQSYEYGLTHSHWHPGTRHNGYVPGGYGWGVGQGWGISMTDGFAALLQRIEDIPQEEFDKRMAAQKEQKRKEREEKAAIAALSEQKNKLKSSIDHAKSNLNHMVSGVDELKVRIANLNDYADAEVIFKKGFLGSKFEVINEKFKHEEDAMAFQAKCKKDVEVKQSEIEGINAQIIAETAKVKSLEEELTKLS